MNSRNSERIGSRLGRATLIVAIGATSLIPGFVKAEDGSDDSSSTRGVDCERVADSLLDGDAKLEIAHSAIFVRSPMRERMSNSILLEASRYRMTCDPDRIVMTLRSNINDGSDVNIIVAEEGGIVRSRKITFNSDLQISSSNKDARRSQLESRLDEIFGSGREDDINLKVFASSNSGDSVYRIGKNGKVIIEQVASPGSISMTRTYVKP